MKMQLIHALGQKVREERLEGVLWLPVWLAVGIGLYFSLPFEPSLLLCYGLGLLVVVGLAAAFRFRLGALFILCWVGVGFLLAAEKAHRVEAPTWRGSQKPVWIHGTVEAREPQGKAERLLLGTIDIWKVPKEETPAKVRIRAYHLPEEVKPGSRIAIKASLRAPPGPAWPGGYDFARAAFFEQIGATGYAVTPGRCLAGCKEEGDFQSHIEQTRHAVHMQIMRESRWYHHPASPAIASALLTGIQGDIPKSVLDALRISGLGHLLSISGLHMVMVAMTVFLFIRHGAAWFPKIALYHDTKKWAAAIALLASGGYLLLAGSPVPAMRACIMLAFFFIALMVDRPGTPLRPLAWAAVVVLVLMPEALLTPGFQMSFAAVVALITSFDAVKTHQLLPAQKGLMMRLISYVLAVVFSSLVAGLATMPFAVYHFGRPAIFGVLSNLLAIPLSSFFIMPMGLLSLMLMPLKASMLPLSLMCIGVDGLIAIASHVAALPYGDLVLPKPPVAAMLLLVFGVLMLALMRTRLRLFGLGLVPLGLLVYLMLLPAPDLLMDSGGKLFAIRSAEGRYYFSSLRAARFARREWANALGIDHPQRLSGRKLPPDALLPWHCDAAECRREEEGRPVLRLVHSAAAGCAPAALTFALGEAAICQGKGRIITRYELAREGTFRVRVTKEGLHIQTSAQDQGKRLWTQTPNPPKK